ncbi:MAG TPA: nuclear transport factor 2 family protein [Solirubrobacteraceae bacterium]|jgi:ketosteroid isomerase-like protein|nr:nuclear transport factor 2 family protein [Solirubrobacteraceae bacterium]
MTNDELLDRLFASIAAGDLDAVAGLYADDVEVWHNSSGRTLARDASMRLLRAFLQRAGDVRYEILERRHWEEGAMQRHVLHVRPNGADHAIDVCITFAFAGGRIRNVREYVDGRALAPLGW